MEYVDIGTQINALEWIVRITWQGITMPPLFRRLQFILADLTNAAHSLAGYFASALGPRVRTYSAAGQDEEDNRGQTGIN